MRTPRPTPTARQPMALLLAGLLAVVAILPALGLHDGSHHLESVGHEGHRHVALTPDHEPHEASQLERGGSLSAEHCTVCTLRTWRSTSDLGSAPLGRIPPSSPCGSADDETAPGLGLPVALHPRAPPRI